MKTRKILLISSMLLFPVTLYYFSPALIFSAGVRGIINGSFVVFVLLFILSIPFGRLFCSHLCPAGGLQDCLTGINNKKIKNNWKKKIKYVVWPVWLTGIFLCYFFSNSRLNFNPWFETTYGISVINIQSYIIYYGIILLIVIPALTLGRRAFCHYICWMSPFMILGIKFRKLLRLPGLSIAMKNRSLCIQCGKCNANCPMSLPVKEIVCSKREMDSECIQCKECVQVCPKNILDHKFTKRSN